MIDQGHEFGEAAFDFIDIDEEDHRAIDFGDHGQKSLSVNARRLYQRSQGTQLTLLAFFEQTELSS